MVKCKFCGEAFESDHDNSLSGMDLLKAHVMTAHKYNYNQIRQRIDAEYINKKKELDKSINF